MLITSYSVYNTDVAIDTTNTRLAQMFTTTRDVQIGRVYVYITVTGTPGGYVYLELQDDSDDVPSGDVVDNGTSEPLLISDITDGLNYIDFDVDARPMVVANTPYHIVVRTSSGYTADATNYISIGVDQTDPYYMRGAASEYASATWGAISPASVFDFAIYTGTRTTMYPSLQQVEALTASLTESASGKYTADTIPTIAQVTDFIDDVSSMIDGLLNGAGIDTPISAESISVIKTYASQCTALQCEMTQMSAGFRADNSDTRAAAFKRMCDVLTKDIMESGNITMSIKEIETGGDVSGSSAVSAGGIYTEDREEAAEDDSLIQPIFSTDMFKH